ncbi:MULTISPECIES: hypothetical protein [unclassified Pseudoxanthomonas]|uniref:hypothetical protein n=1 Tax=unclassified Pseudoxanthomonas TaxID=2645906 RepID=UPI00111459AA|nr:MULTISPECIES: hypothetical protein [unclassified Pseudoxanthomonas]
MAMTQETRTEGSIRADNTVADWPLKFVRHNFGAHCFDTIGCRITYSGFTHGADEGEVSPPLSSYRGAREQILSAGHIARTNFPPPVRIAWRSRNGVAHETEIDIRALFPGQLIVHNVAREDIREGVSITDPDIILEVEDRTISVYMRAFIPTKVLQVPGNPYSGHRAELVRVWSEMY